MGRRVRAHKTAHRRGVRGRPGHPAPSKHRPHGRRRQPKEIPPLGAVFAKTVRHFAPDLPKAIEALPDHRKAEDVLYPKANIVWSGILMFLMGLGSRRQFRFESDSAAFVANVKSTAITALTAGAPGPRSLPARPSRPRRLRSRTNRPGDHA